MKSARSRNTSHLCVAPQAQDVVRVESALVECRRVTQGVCEENGGRTVTVTTVLPRTKGRGTSLVTRAVETRVAAGAIEGRGVGGPRTGWRRGVRRRSLLAAAPLLLRGVKRARGARIHEGAVGLQWRARAESREPRAESSPGSVIIITESPFTKNTYDSGCSGYAHRSVSIEDSTYRRSNRIETMAVSL